MTEETAGRRLSDRVARWMEVILLAALSGLLGLITYFYGGIPGQINQLVGGSQNLQLEVRYMKEELQDLKEANRTSQDWRTRQAVLEQRADRQSEQLAAHERRLDKLEDRPTLFGGPGKNRQP